MSSKIDDLFEKIYGFKPNKDGAAYEMLSAAVLKLLEEKQEVFHDQKLRGQFSKSLYQLDVLLRDSGTTKMVEAKDYTIRDGKVGRGDMQKLGGALGDVEVDAGAFFSATGYTAPAKKYAAASKDINYKPISLFNLRPSTKQDENGRIKEIHINFHIATPIYERAVYQPVFSNEGRKVLDQILEEKQTEQFTISTSISTILDFEGKLLETVADITRVGLGLNEDKSAYVSFITKGGHIVIEGKLVGINGFTAVIPYHELVEELVIKANGEAKVYIAAEDGTVNKLLTDLDLKRAVFTDDGEIKLKPKKI